MIEVLFRAKRLDNGEWIEGYYASKGKGTDLEKHFIVSSTFDSNTNAYPFYFTDIEVDPKTVCQYTGLTDKNGRKIFVGNIVKIGLEHYEVWWNCDSSSITLSSENESRGLYLSHNETIEVIGNIFDNPELIGEQP